MSTEWRGSQTNDIHIFVLESRVQSSRRDQATKTGHGSFHLAVLSHLREYEADGPTTGLADEQERSLKQCVQIPRKTIKSLSLAAPGDRSMPRSREARRSG